jgi:hypothetical protein
MRRTSAPPAPAVRNKSFCQTSVRDAPLTHSIKSKTFSHAVPCGASSLAAGNPSSSWGNTVIQCDCAGFVHCRYELHAASQIRTYTTMGDQGSGVQLRMFGSMWR